MLKKALVFALLAGSLTPLVANDDVVVAAQKAGNTLFYDAVMAAGLYEHAKKDVGQEKSLAPFTVFVPNNGAFSAIKDLDPKEQKKIITYHVSPGRKVLDLEKDLASGIPTVGEVLVFGNKKEVYLEDSTIHAGVVSGPHEARNGVFYVIDQVLRPSHDQTETTAPSAPTTAPVEAEQKTAEPKQKSDSSTHPKESEAMQFQPVANTQMVAAITQLTSAVQLLTHVIQQAQAQAMEQEASTHTSGATLVQQIPQVGVKSTAVTE